MLKTLGPASEVVRRREERILHLRKLDQKLAEINSLIAQHIGNSEAAAAGESAATSRRDWSNDKDIWMSNSSLDLQLAEDKQYSVIHKFTIFKLTFITIFELLFKGYCECYELHFKYSFKSRPFWQLYCAQRSVQ